MKYSELFQFDPIEAAVRLRTADDVNEAGRLVRTYAISDEMADRWANLVMPNLRLDASGGNKGLLVIGRPDAGTSHLLAVVSALAEHRGLAENVGRADVAGAVQAIAGNFKVLRVEPDVSTTDLRDFLCRQLAACLGRWGVQGAAAIPAGSPSFRGWFAEMMGEFNQTFPEHGLLLVLDQLTDYLLGRKGKAMTRDLAFLQEIGAACGSFKFRFVTELREEVFDLPIFARVAHSFRKTQSPFVHVTIPETDARCIVQGRLLKKTAQQQTRVREHLAPFAGFFGDMSQRLEEFVALFPVHPDYFKVVGQIGFVEPWNMVRTLSDVVKNLLAEAVPTDRPGLIAYDSCWEKLLNNPARRSVPEFQAVINCSKLLEGKATEVFTEPEDRSLALRLIHALSVHRLTTGSIYRKTGPTPVELRDTLCLYPPDAKEGAAAPADELLSRVIAVFSQLHERVKGLSLAVNPYNQCYLRLNRFKRFHGAELVLHWVNAIPFLLLLMTGGAMVLSRFVPMEGGVFHRVVMMHKVCATLWVVLMPLTVLFRLKVHWVDIRVMTKWGREDIVWMLESLRSLRKKDSPLTPVGRFNTGQKINACLVILYFFSFGSTGILMLWKASMLFPWYLHTALFFSATASVGGHLYLALLNPSTRIALAGIFHGWSPLKYVEHHHPLSLPEVLRTHVPPPQVRRLRDELLVTRTELIAVSVAFTLAGTILALSYHWQITAIKKDFTKSFSDCINPSELSTKHRIGPTAESCTKCHLFTGEIPDAKCEQCHADVKERRTQLVGYHGTFKGECIRCHKEHPARSPVFVPLDKEKFDHALASFKLEGKHAKVTCDECHKKLRTPETPGIYYLGLKHDSCTDCHKGPHGGQFTAACETCHSVKGWTGNELKFSHAADSAFKLAGKHSPVECVKCHKPKSPLASLGTAVFKGLPQDCKDCHPDPHRQQFSATCTACHSPAGWKKDKLSFDHNKDAKFPLVARHAEVACEKCHLPRAPGTQLASAQFRNLKAECADCHKDPHRGQFEAPCIKCHLTPVEWRLASRQFQHNKDTHYPLAGKHAAVACAKCHPPQPAGGPLGSATFKGLATGCEACHKVTHPPEYGPSCTACHTFDSFPKKNPGFEHIFKIKIAGENLIGKHLSAKCSACHDGVKIGGLERPHSSELACRTCHQPDDPHKNVLGNNCSKCHNAETWKGENLRFNHDTMASFSLDQDHRNLACTKCHENGHWKPLEAKCENCHSKRFLEKKK